MKKKKVKKPRALANVAFAPNTPDPVNMSAPIPSGSDNADHENESVERQMRLTPNISSNPQPEECIKFLMLVLAKFAREAEGVSVTRMLPLRRIWVHP